MITYNVSFSPEAESQLISLYEYISVNSSKLIAENYTNAIVAFCESMSIFPHRGILRNDIRPDLRITNYKKKVTIAFYIDEDREIIYIVGIFYGGQNYDTFLEETD